MASNEKHVITEISAAVEQLDACDADAKEITARRKQARAPLRALGINMGDVQEFRRLRDVDEDERTERMALRKMIAQACGIKQGELEV